MWGKLYKEAYIYNNAYIVLYPSIAQPAKHEWKW